MNAHPPSPAPHSPPSGLSPEALVKVCIVFLAVCAAAVAACLTGAFSSEGYRAFPEIENTYRLLMAAELFFLLFLWPLYCGTPGAVSAPALGTLLVVSVPLVLIAARVSNVPAYMVARTHLLLLTVAAASAAACKLILRVGPRSRRWYYPLAAGLAGGLPLVQFVLLDISGGAGARWLSCASPFWAMELALLPPGEVPRAYWPGALLVFAGVAAVLRITAERGRAREDGKRGGREEGMKG
ncbi:MAG TPA: hypothetical protein VM223_26060 [Planctomycetota bacterium]|nr:hypothetical protein [Planctomycetota bacterium]